MAPSLDCPKSALPGVVALGGGSRHDTQGGSWSVRLVDTECPLEAVRWQHKETKPEAPGLPLSRKELMEEEEGCGGWESPGFQGSCLSGKLFPGKRFC